MKKMQKILVSIVAVAFVGLFACVALGPVLFSHNVMQAGCMNMDAQSGTSDFCSTHSDLYAAISSGSVFTLAGFSLAAMLLTVVFVLCLSFIPSRARLLSGYVSDPPSTSFLLHRKTVLIRP